MIRSFEYIKGRLPITLSVLFWEDPILHLSGDNWIFNARTEWRIIFKGGEKVIGCYDDYVKEALVTFKDLRLTSIQQQSRFFFDPVLVFENGNIIEIFSSSTKEETWTFRFIDDNVFIESNEQ